MQKNRNAKGRQNKGRATARNKNQENSADASVDEVLADAEQSSPAQQDVEKVADPATDNSLDSLTDSPEDSLQDDSAPAATDNDNADADPSTSKEPEPLPTEIDSPESELPENAQPEDIQSEDTPRQPQDERPQQSAPSEQVKKPGKGALIVAIFALLIAIAAVAGFVYLWMQQQEERTAKAGDTAAQSTQLQSLAGNLQTAAAGRDKNAAAISATQQQVAQIDGRLEGLNGQVSNIAGVIDLANQANASVKVYDTRIEQLEKGVGSLREIAEGGRNAWRKAEIEYLLVVANQRLQVYGDPKTAEAALNAADKRLLELGDAQLVPLRQLIADEVAAVKSVERADVSGLAFSLGSHAERVSQLPIKRELGGKAHYSSGDDADKAAAEAAEKGVDWDKLWGGIYGELKTLVVVRRNGKPVEPMLPPAAEFFLEQNLRLKLESARAALLRGDSENFTASLRTAKSWLEAYFNGEDSAVQAMLASLAEMEGVNISPTLPDISPSLTMLRQINQNAAQ